VTANATETRTTPLRIMTETPLLAMGADGTATLTLLRPEAGLGEDSREGVSASLEKRPPRFTGR
jgi:hypothetical protein